MELTLRTYSGRIRKKLLPHQIFVFGSNSEGRHGMGAALWAAVHAGAKKGVASGPCNQSYAIITKNLRAISHPSVSKDSIVDQIRKLYTYALTFPEKEFIIPYGDTKNLNAYTPTQMALMFLNAGMIPENLCFKEDFAEILRRLSKGLTQHYNEEVHIHNTGSRT